MFLRRTQTNNATVRKVKKRKDTFLRAVSARSIPVLLPSLVQNSNLFFPFELFCVLSLFSLCKSPTCFLSSVCSLNLLSLFSLAHYHNCRPLSKVRGSVNIKSLCVYPGKKQKRKLNFWMWKGFALKLFRTTSTTITSKLKIKQQSLWVCQWQQLGLWRLPYNCSSSSILLEYAKSAATNDNRFLPYLPNKASFKCTPVISHRTFFHSPLSGKMSIPGQRGLEDCRGTWLAWLSAKCSLPVRAPVYSGIRVRSR